MVGERGQTRRRGDLWQPSLTCCTLHRYCLLCLVFSASVLMFSVGCEIKVLKWPSASSFYVVPPPLPLLMPHLACNACVSSHAFVSGNAGLHIGRCMVCMSERCSAHICRFHSTSLHLLCSCTLPVVQLHRWPTGQKGLGNSAILFLFCLKAFCCTYTQGCCG